MKYQVQVIEKSTGNIIDTVGKLSADKQRLQQVARGVAINLDHDLYRVNVNEVEETNV